MPLYEYQCDACGEVYEELVRLSERDRAVACRRCGSDATHRLVSAPALGGLGGGDGGGCAPGGG